MATILHVADPRIDPSASFDARDDTGGRSSSNTDSRGDADASRADTDTSRGTTGGFDTLVERAKSLDADVVLFTGNLFSRGRPDEAAVERVVNALDELDAAGVRVLTVLGRNDRRQQDALEAVFDHPAVERLGTEPTGVGENTAVYGIDHQDSEEFQTFLDEDDQFTPGTGNSNTILAVARKLAPPLDRDSGATQPYEVASNVNAYVDVIAGGGIQDPGSWEHEDNDFGVYYPGSMNQRWADDPIGPTAMLYEEDGHNLSRRQIPLETTSLDGEVETLETLLSEYQQSSLETADVETLADLYGLLAEARSLLNDRRKEVRDVLIDRTAPGAEYRGRRASVYHQQSTRTNMRDDESVFQALEGAGLERDEVTSETIDEDKVTEVVEEGMVPKEAVFEESTRTSIRKRDVDLDSS